MCKFTDTQIEDIIRQVRIQCTNRFFGQIQITQFKDSFKDSGLQTDFFVVKLNCPRDIIHTTTFTLETLSQVYRTFGQEQSLDDNVVVQKFARYLVDLIEKKLLRRIRLEFVKGEC